MRWSHNRWPDWRWLALTGACAVGMLFVWQQREAAQLLAERESAALFLRPKLQALRGLTGLDPLDPAEPLAYAQVVGLDSSAFGQTFPRVRFTYAGGASRDYVVTVSHRQSALGGWLYTGLDRLFAPHEALPDLPSAAEEAFVHLGVPERLAVADALQGAGTGMAALSTEVPYGPDAWPWWSPTGDALALPMRTGTDALPRWELWLVRLTGEAPTRLAEAVRGARWTPDGEAVVYVDSDGRTGALVLSDRAGRLRWRVPLPAGPFAIAAGPRGVFVARENALWQVPYTAPGSMAPALAFLRDLPDLSLRGETPVSVAPDGARLAYACGADVCFADTSGGQILRTSLPVPGRAAAARPPPVRVAALITPCPLPPAAFEADARPDPQATRIPAQAVPRRRPGTPAIPGPMAAAPSPRPIGPGCAPVAVFPPLVHMTWSPNGSQLAVVRAGDWYQPRLAIVDRDGVPRSDVVVGPNGRMDPPRWTPDGRLVFLGAYPEMGRRVVAVDVSSGRVVDLTEPRWDAFSSLAPDGRRLLLTNGRGGFWLAPVRS